MPDWAGQLAQPISANSRNDLGDTPLHVASVQGNVTAATDLLDVGADPNAIGEHGYTPLHEAVERSYRAVVHLLISRGASTAIRNASGETAVDSAHFQADLQIIELLSRQMP